MFRMRFGSRRRKASWATLPIALVLVLCSWGYDDLCRTSQTKEAWQGTIEKGYTSSLSFASTDRKRRRFWDVRSSDGSVRSVRVYSDALWRMGRPGDPVVKHAGQLEPYLMQCR